MTLAASGWRYGGLCFSYSGVRAPRVQIDELLPCWRTALRCSRATWSFPYGGFPRQTASVPPQAVSVLLNRAARRRGRIHWVRYCCSWCHQTSHVETVTSLAFMFSYCVKWMVSALPGGPSKSYVACEAGLLLRDRPFHSLGLGHRSTAQIRRSHCATSSSATRDLCRNRTQGLPHILPHPNGNPVGLPCVGR
jgi:hypothetical protein